MNNFKYRSYEQYKTSGTSSFNSLRYSGTSSWTGSFHTMSQSLLLMRINNGASILVILTPGNLDQGHPTTIFGKYLFGRRFEI